jgi:hypothetical protein
MHLHIDGNESSQVLKLTGAFISALGRLRSGESDGTGTGVDFTAPETVIATHTALGSSQQTAPEPPVEQPVKRTRSRRTADATPEQGNSGTGTETGTREAVSNTAEVAKTNAEQPAQPAQQSAPVANAAAPASPEQLRGALQSVVDGGGMPVALALFAYYEASNLFGGNGRAGLKPEDHQAFIAQCERLSAALKADGGIEKSRDAAAISQLITSTAASA